MKSAVELWSIMIYNAPTEKTRKKKECKEAKKECWLFTSYCKQNDVNGLGAVSRNHLDAAAYRQCPAVAMERSAGRNSPFALVIYTR